MGSPFFKQAFEKLNGPGIFWKAVAAIGTTDQVTVVT
jgi:hypothetical protein